MNHLRDDERIISGELHKRSADRVSSNAETSASQKPTAHAQLINHIIHQFTDGSEADHFDRFGNRLGPCDCSPEQMEIVRQQPGVTAFAREGADYRQDCKQCRELVAHTHHVVPVNYTVESHHEYDVAQKL